MALGGGVFYTQNKVLPGAYINFVSAGKASASLSDRGIVALAVSLNWGADGKVFTVTQEEFQKDSLKIFGYTQDEVELKPLRDLFLNAKTAYLYRLNTGVNASNTFATAKYSGTRGNDLKTVIVANVDEPTKFDVATYLGTTKVDEQKAVATAADLVANDFCTFKEEATLVVTVGTAFTLGANAELVTGTEYTAFLAAIEAYSFNAIGCMSADSTIEGLFVAFTKRLRDDMGVKFQCVLFNKAGDFEGVINVKNSIDLIPWVVGAAGACAINKSNTNKTYDGEYEVTAAYTQAQLEATIKAGEFVFHKVGDEFRVLADVNSLVTITVEKGADFQSNQTIRVLDQIANDIAVLFNGKYLGKIQNNASGRISFWSDLVAYNKALESYQAIENFSADDVVVGPGTDKKSVVVSNPVTPVNCMEKLYMTVIVQ